MIKKIRIGTRKSILALKQASIFIDYLLEKIPDFKDKIEVVKIETSGDKVDKPLGDKGLFIKELELAILDRNIDMQWHEQYEAGLAALTAEEVNRVMRKYIKLEDFSIIKAGDMTKAIAQAGDNKDGKSASE